MSDELQVTHRADRGDVGARVDLMLVRHLTGLRGASRTRVQAWIENGRVLLNGTPVQRPATRLALGDLVSLAVPAGVTRERDDARERAGELPPLQVLYEDDHLLAIDKPAGVVVHPGYKNTSGTMMNALRWHGRYWPAPQRPSIVGRLDKLTSGIVVVAKSAAHHALLQRAMGSDATKDYLAVVYGRVNVARGRIGLRLSRDPDDRRRVVASQESGAHSLTTFERLGRVAAPAAGLSLLRCSLLTGRMHQIRVHLFARGWPIVGDPVYGEPRWSRVNDPALATALRAFPRQALHAWRLDLKHPVSGARVLIEARVPRDLDTLLNVTGLRLP